MISISNNKVSVIFLLVLTEAYSLLPPKFEWSNLDFDWTTTAAKNEAIKSGDFISENNMPVGLARWNNKLFITVPRWKTGVPSSLNYVEIDGDGDESALLHPYPNWEDGYVHDSNPVMNSNSTVVSTFRMDIDRLDRLWVVDNGIADISDTGRGRSKVTDPAVVVFDLKTDKLVRRFTLPRDIVKPDSAFTSIVVDIPTSTIESKEGETVSPDDVFAYITDMGSDALIVYDLRRDMAWRYEHPFFNFEPEAGKYKVGGMEFFWSDGISSATLGAPGKDKFPVLYFQPTSSNRQYKISTNILRFKKNKTDEALLNGVELSKNGFGCWNVNKPFNPDNVVPLMSDCGILEFPSDIKVDSEGNIWILSNRQSRFLYGNMDYSQTNFRVLTVPISLLVEGTPCDEN